MGMREGVREAAEDMIPRKNENNQYNTRQRRASARTGGSRFLACKQLLKAGKKAPDNGNTRLRSSTNAGLHRPKSLSRAPAFDEHRLVALASYKTFHGRGCYYCCTAPDALLKFAAIGEAERFLPPLIPVVASVTHLNTRPHRENVGWFYLLLVLMSSLIILFASNDPASACSRRNTPGETPYHTELPPSTWYTRSSNNFLARPVFVTTGSPRDFRTKFRRSCSKQHALKV